MPGKDHQLLAAAGLRSRRKAPLVENRCKHLAKEKCYLVESMVRRIDLFTLGERKAPRIDGALVRQGEIRDRPR